MQMKLACNNTDSRPPATRVEAPAIPSSGTAKRPHQRSPLKGTLSELFIFGSFLVIFLACHASVLSTDYGFADDYDALVHEVEGNTIKHVRDGRPLFALWLKLVQQATTDIGDLRWVRLTGILCISLLAYGVFRSFMRTGCGRPDSWCMAVIMCSTLPFQVYAAWAMTAFYPFAAFVSGLAFHLGDRASSSVRPRMKWPLAAGAVLVLAAAMMIYQPAGMFFWVFAALSLLTQEETPQGDTIRRLAWYCMIGLAGMLLGVGAYGIANALHPESALRELTQLRELPILIGLFVLEALPNALNFSMPSPGRLFLDEGSAVHYRTADRLFACGVLVVIAGGLAVHFRGTGRERLWKFGVAACLVPLSYAANFVSLSNLAQYRTLPALTSIVVLYMYLAFLGYGHLLRRPLFPSARTVFLGGLAAVCTLSAAWHVRSYFVTPQARELTVMRSQLTGMDLARVDTIHVIRPRPHVRAFGPLVSYEFGYPSSEPVWNVRAMISLLLREVAPKYAHLPVTIADANDSIDPVGALVVDMRNFRGSGEWLLSDDPRAFGTPMIRSDFDVYLFADTLNYVKEPCTAADTQNTFFLHLTPADADDLPDHRKSSGYDNLDFHFDTLGVTIGEKCIATIPLPGYAVAHVRTGQPGAWEGEFPIARMEQH